MTKNNNNLEQQETLCINDEITKEERKTQKKIKQKAQQERKKGRIANIGYQMFRIYDIEW